MTTRKALITFAFWVSVAIAVNLYILFQYGTDLAAQFLGAWAMEETLSLDNLFMFYFIFTTFQTPREARLRVLHWGIIGVIVMRGAIIAGGTALLNAFHWLLLGFALFLLWAAAKIFFFEEKEQDPEAMRAGLERNWLFRGATKLMPFDAQYHGDRFVIEKNGKKHGTLLLLVLLVVEGTDVPFAFDSLPAAMAVSQNFWIIASSNLLAVLGLRSIYFLIENMQDRFAYMKYGIGILLGFAGVKIILKDALNFEIPLLLSLGIIVGVIVTTILYTLYRSRPEAAPNDLPPGREP